MTTKTELIFFAYQGRYRDLCDDNVDSIKKAIENYNQYQKRYVAKSWEEYKKTNWISREILSVIDSCEVFVCDLTYFNYNVLFELGYAISKNKEILVLLNEDIGNAKEKYKDFILKNLKYTSFQNYKSIQTALQQSNFQKGLLSSFVTLGNIEQGSVDIFYKQSDIQNQASLDLTEAVKNFSDKRECVLVTDDASEVGYQPLKWYFQNIIKSKIVLIHFLGRNVSNELTENAENSFYAGISCGLNREVLLMAPSKYQAPLDYHEILVQYGTSEILSDTVIGWLGERIALPERLIQKKKIEEEHEYNLIKLGVGCDIAENEKAGLLNYFVPTSSYNAVLGYEKSILVGRKGSGKSAICIKLLDEASKDSQNLVISLKPESDELFEDIEMSNLFDSQASKRSFFFTVWKLVIFSKLIVVINEQLLVKPPGYNYSEFENEILKFVEKNEYFINLNFFGVVKEISKKAAGGNIINNPKILEHLYKEFLTPLVSALKQYFSSISAKYYKIVILADSLDKTWDSKHNLDVQVEMILTLLEIEHKITKELLDKKGFNVEVKEIIFLRKDIFDYILREALEPDKLITMSHEINWENYPNKFKKLIDDRFKHILNLPNVAEVEGQAWKEFFDLGQKVHPYNIIEEIITRRPRDLIYFINKLFESSIDNGHAKVTKDDLQYAISCYTVFLNNNLIAETKAEFPEIADILAKLQKYHGEKIEYKKFCEIVRSFSYTQKRVESLVEALFLKGYMIGFDYEINKPFHDLGILKSKLSKKKFFFFNNKVYVIAHAKYYYIKNKIPSPF